MSKNNKRGKTQVPASKMPAISLSNNLREPSPPPIPGGSGPIRPLPAFGGEKQARSSQGLQDGGPKKDTKFHLGRFSVSDGTEEGDLFGGMSQGEEVAARIATSSSRSPAIPDPTRVAPSRDSTTNGASAESTMASPGLTGTSPSPVQPGAEHIHPTGTMPRQGLTRNRPIHPRSRPVHPGAERVGGSDDSFTSYGLATTASSPPVIPEAHLVRNERDIEAELESRVQQETAGIAEQVERRIMQNAVRANVVSSSTERNAARKKWSLILILIAIAVVGAIVATLVVVFRNNDEPPTQGRVVAIRERLEEEFDGASFDDQESPHYKALEWLALNDTLQLSEDSPFLKERYVVALLYFATRGEDWTHNYGFLSNSSVCTWNDGNPDLDYRQGVSCDGDDPTESVTHVVFEDNNLVGSLPDEIMSLSYLLALNCIAENQLVGTIPSSIGQCTSLVSLILGDNALTGPLPTEIGLLSNLYGCYLYKNKLTGTIPSEVGLLTGLDYLELNVNEMSGTIPSTIGWMKNLIGLGLSSNRLTGTVPTEIAALPNLEALHLDANDLEGSLDPFFCDYRSDPIGDFYADCLATPPEVECSCCNRCCSGTFHDTTCEPPYD